MDYRSVSCFLAGLSSDEDERASEIRDLVRKSSTPGWERETAIQIYNDAGSGRWDGMAINDINALLCAIRENPALLAVVESDIENLVQRSGASFRRTWDWVRRNLKPATRLKEAPRFFDQALVGGRRKRVEPEEGPIERVSEGNSSSFR